MPTFAAGYAVLRRHAPRLPRPVGVLPWAAGVAAFAVLDVALMVGTSYWRLSRAQALWPAIQDTQTRWDLAVARLADPHHLFRSLGWDLPAPRLDLDLAAALAQAAAQTAVFAVLLAASVVLAAHRQRVLALLSVLAPAVSVTAMTGVLASYAPPLLATGAEEPLSVYSSWPASLQPIVARLYSEVGTAVLPVWWRVALGSAVGLIGAAVVLRVLLRSRRLVVPDGRPSPLLVGLVVGVTAATGVAMEPVSGEYVHPSVVVCTFAVAVVLGAAASLLGGVSALLLATAALGAQLAADGAPTGMWAWTPGWYEGPMAEQPTAWPAVALVSAPLLGWILAVAWAALPIHEPTNERAGPSVALGAH
jgi:hypothetical protein